MLNKLKNAFKQKQKPQPTTASKEKYLPKVHILGTHGRDSYNDPENRTGFFTLKRPKEKERFSLKRVTLKQLLNSSPEKSIQQLIEISSTLSQKVDTYIDKTCKDFDLITEDDNDRMIIQNFIDRMGGKDKFLELLKRFAYGVYVEGAFCGELVFSLDGAEAVTIKYVSPLTLTSEQRTDPTIGQYDVIGQWIDNELKVLYDEADPEKYRTFIHNPVRVRGNDPFGSSGVVPCLFSITAALNLVELFVDFYHAKAFPKGLYSIDTDSLQQFEDLTIEDLDKIAEQATEELKKQLDSGDATQDTVLSTKVIYQLIGTIENANVDGIEMVMEMLERDSHKSLPLPRSITAMRRTGQSLNDNESRVEWLAFAEALDVGRASIELPINEFFRQILLSEGSPNEVLLELDRTDPELERIETELFDMKLAGYKTLSEINQKERIVTQQEFRSLVALGLTKLTDLPQFKVDLPPELEGALPINTPTPEPEPEGSANE